MKVSFTKPYFAASLLLAAAAFTISCTVGNGPGPCPLAGAAGSNCCNGNIACVFSEFLYATALNQVVSFSINNGTGVPTMQASVAFPNDSGGVLSAFGTIFVYVSDSPSNKVYGFSSVAGSLTPIPGSPFSGVTAPGRLAYNGKFLCAPNSTSNNVSIFSIFNGGQNGPLTAVAGSPFPAGSGPTAAAFGAIHFLYVSNSTDPQGGISGYSIDQNTGALTPVPGSPFATLPNAGPGGIVVPGAGKLLFVALTNRASVAAFSVDSNTGALTPVPGSPFAAGSQPLDIAADEAGSYVYTADGTGNTITGFAIGSNGVLTPVPGSPFAAGTTPSRLIVDHFGRLYVTNNASNNISGFSLNTATGALTPLSGSPFTAGTQPISITSGL